MSNDIQMVLGKKSPLFRERNNTSSVLTRVKARPSKFYSTCTNKLITRLLTGSAEDQLVTY